MNKMPYIVAYNMLMGSRLSIAIQGMYPDFYSAKQWVGEKEGYHILELPEKSGGMVHVFEWKLEPR